MNELDFAISLSGEFRGAQDAGWSTTITAYEVYQEILAKVEAPSKSKAEFRNVLMLYCQLAEAGGVYESLKNVMGVVALNPYLLWPFKDLVQVRGSTKRVIGPNANATFRDLAANAKEIGLTGLSSLLGLAFREDLRNGISHADYVIWDDGVRLRNRNDGHAKKLSCEEINVALTCGINFFQILTQTNAEVIKSYNPPKTIVGRFSANPPMPWTVSYDPSVGSFGISGSSPGSITTPEYLRQIAINGFLGGKVLALFAVKQFGEGEIETFISDAGFEPHCVLMTDDAMNSFLDDISQKELWDQRCSKNPKSELLLLSPWGFRWLLTTADFKSILDDPILEFDFASPQNEEPKGS
jgi:hypothetical protein